MSLIEQPVSRLRLSFEIDAQDPDGLNFLHKTVTHAAARFDLKLIALVKPAPLFIGDAPQAEAEPEFDADELQEAAAPTRTPDDWSKLVTLDLWLQIPRLTEMLHLDHAVARAKRMGAVEAKVVEAPPTVAASPPPSAPQPKSRAEALVMVAQAADSITKAPLVGKTVPVDPQQPKPASAGKPSLNDRLVAKLRALFRAGDPIPGNKELGDELGVPSKHIGVALSHLRKIEAIDYEWRPAPTLEDETLQRRFVTKA